MSQTGYKGRAEGPFIVPRLRGVRCSLVDSDNVEAYALGLVYARSYKTEKGTMVACCDKELLGQIFREGKLKLSLQTNFYGNATVDLLEALVLLDGADILNLVGENIVRAAIDRGLVHPHAVISIAGVPHVQVMKV